MKTLNKTFFSLLITTLFATVVLAQPGRSDRSQRGLFLNIPAEVKAEAHLAVFDEYLDLTDDQKTELNKTELLFAKKSAAFRTENFKGKDSKSQFFAIRNEHQQAIHQILTKEQYSVFLDQQEAIRNDIRQRLKSTISNNGN